MIHRILCLLTLASLTVLAAEPRPDIGNDGGAPPKKAAAAKEPEFVPPFGSASQSKLEAGRVRVDLFENGVKDEVPSETYFEPSFAFAVLPKKYNNKAVIADRATPFTLRAMSSLTLREGQWQLLLRAKNPAKLFVDDKLVATVLPPKGDGDGHEAVSEVHPTAPNTRMLRLGHNESVVDFASDGKPHVITLLAVLGKDKRRPETGELLVGVAEPGQPFSVLGPKDFWPLTDKNWETHFEAQRAVRAEADSLRRKTAAEKEQAYWDFRHELGRKFAGEDNAPNSVDAVIAKQLPEDKPAPLVDDLAFLRRASIDVTGTIPGIERVQRFIADSSPQKRARMVDELLNDPAWADNWVGYWQDVLAENPGIVKPQLNNTGPFRYWIYESFLDNKAIDRFATELIMMEGSQYYGGPAGFAMASQNDAPMAEKAHVLSKAFMAAEMKCARCHDAPHHNFTQENLFAAAAMLKRGAQDVPKTSSIPLGAKEIRKLEVSVTLVPGTKVQPAWPFEEIVHGIQTAGGLPQGVLHNEKDTRELFAAMVTSPHNDRFASVIVNRLWKRYMGMGIVEPVDDWERVKPASPELLAFLSRELIAHDYDLKHVARLILNSRAYQRVPAATNTFAAQSRRKMVAEQIVDSLYAAAGKRLESEEMTLDPDGRRPVDAFLNFGFPRRAWQVSSLSNERDRPALSLPKVQNITDLLMRFGWRDSRQSPLTVREDSPTVMQPAVIANGPLTNGCITRLSDDNAITELCLTQQPLNELVDRLFLRLLTRHPSAEELSVFSALLRDGYEQRLTNVKAPAETVKRPLQVAWSNHLSPDATRIKMQLEKEAREGAPPTERLAANWRERMEDAIWALINTPEFLMN